MKYLIFLLPILLLTACSDTAQTDTDLTGKWQGIAWLINGETSDRDASQVTFEFQAEGTYSAAFGTISEAGDYWMEGTKLYTHATGQAEKMVETTLNGNDTLRINMNRAGTPEVLVLVRQ